MKLPEKPPPLDGVMKRANSNGRLIHVVTTPPGKGEYYHWDEIRRRPPPGVLSVEEWWLALKLNRKATMRELPCKSNTGEPFSFSMPDQLLEYLHKIDFGPGSSIGSSDDNMNSALRNRYRFSSLSYEAIASSVLEGAVTTREVAKELIRTSRTPRDKSEWMILNNFRAMQKIKSLGARSLTPDLVFEIHRQITENTLENPNAAGRFRNAGEQIRVVDSEGNIYHEPPAAESLPERMKMMCEFANGRESKQFGYLPPVVRAIILHFWLAYDHPFVDGNGRTARALFYWSLLRQGLGRFEFISISEALRNAPMQYYKSFLFTETDDNDLTYFILHQLKTILRAIENLDIYVERKQNEMNEAAYVLRTYQSLNFRQISALDTVLRHPEREFTIDAYKDEYRIARATAKSDLMEIVKLELLYYDKAPGKTKNTMIFKPVKDLAYKLGNLKNNS